jgi:hypothetical protein
MMTKPAEVQKLAEIVTNLQHWLDGKTEAGNKRRAGDCAPAKRARPPFAYFTWNPDRQTIMAGQRCLWSSDMTADDMPAVPSFADCKAMWAALDEISTSL